MYVVNDNLCVTGLNVISYQSTRIKCNLIVHVFRNIRRQVELDDLHEVVIAKVDGTKFLGVVVDENLTCKPHINDIQNLIAENIGIIYWLSSFMLNLNIILRTL